ncbi:bifunctional 4-hydroxy-2-oxoglutarate aldolase/2-dehydro-3-deoxy-phosphogluconate aldolase [Paremcibacter congregatus]|uniref:bifunctional 4-hydroxy-2-oxoglutarate aldolase/2-dehydro-3-deoxy-phosphogluconate aldolase n=1 Tax=Paremcibacter congregatus TaxID=2043170 RepID=UPI003A95BC69
MSFDKKHKISDFFMTQPILPILQVDKPSDAVMAVKALQEGGVHVVEVVLRTAVSLAAITAIRHMVPDMVVGAGTITSADLAIRAKEAGAQFLVSPGSTARLLRAMSATGLPALPGVSTAGDIVRGLEMGFEEMKFFPANINGGIPALKTFGDVFKTVKFCPTGGINGNNAMDYLALPNVFAVGGSWLLPKDAIQQGQKHMISETCRQMVNLFTLNN